MKGGKDDSTLVAEAIDVIDRNVRVQVQLIEDLLDMSRIVSGNLRLAIKPIYAQGFIELAIETILPAASAKEITIDRAIEAINQPTAGDAGRLQQVMWNLLSNAIKFTPSGGKIGIELRAINSNNFVNL